MFTSVPPFKIKRGHEVHHCKNFAHDLETFVKKCKGSSLFAAPNKILENVKIALQRAVEGRAIEDTKNDQNQSCKTDIKEIRDKPTVSKTSSSTKARKERNNNKQNEKIESPLPTIPSERLVTSKANNNNIFFLTIFRNLCHIFPAKMESLFVFMVMKMMTKKVVYQGNTICGLQK